MAHNELVCSKDSESVLLYLSEIYAHCLLIKTNIILV